MVVNQERKEGSQCCPRRVEESSSRLTGRRRMSRPRFLGISTRRSQFDLFNDQLPKTDHRCWMH